MKTFFSELKTSLLLTIVFVITVCGAYPLAVWAGAQIFFKEKANGSLVVDTEGVIRGSKLLAQNFSSDRYFHPRPSAAGVGYDGTASSGTNLGPTSAKLANGVHAKDAAGKAVDDPANFDGVADLVSAYVKSNGLQEGQQVPADAVTRSGSGLDPHITVANAELQVARVARTRNLPAEQVRALIAKNTADRDLGVFGEPGVNVLLLNVDLDRIASSK